MSKQPKEKPSYNVWQNVCYIGGNLIKTDKLLTFYMFVFVAASVAASVVELFLPKTVVQMVESQVSLRTLALTILTFSAAIALTEGLKALTIKLQQAKKTDQRIKYSVRMAMKNCTTDYCNLSKESFKDAMKKAEIPLQHNRSAAEMIFTTIQMLVINVLSFFIYLTLLTVIHPLILALVLVTSVSAFFLRRRVNQWKHDNDKLQVEPFKRIYFLEQAAKGSKYAKDIRLFGLGDWLDDLWKANEILFTDFDKKVSLKHLAVDAFDCIASFLREGVAYVYLIYMVLYQGMPVDQFVLLFAAIGGFSAFVTGILEEYSTLHRFSLDICRLREFLEYPQTFRHDGTPVPKADAYELELRDVSFRYEGAEENTLEHINLKINASEKLAVVGLNGAGKTTLIQLLCGLYDPTEGEVLLNGRNIKEFDRNEYYKQFAAVFQNFSILPYSIAKNVASAEEEDIDYDRVRACLKQADIAEKVDSLPEKERSLLDKTVNLDAVQLSGGETQRLMLARALYKDAPILLLDEPTAALDPIAESRMYQQYDALSKGKTAIYISHRLASTFFCDRIILIADKHIAEEGTHAQLMDLCGQYADLFEIQSRYYKEHPEGELTDEQE